MAYVYLPETSLEDQELVMDVSSAVWKRLVDTTSFTEMIRLSDRNMVERAMRLAWPMFKDALAERTPTEVPA